MLIVGEPGLGKSRLIEEFDTRLRETPHTWVEWSCSQLLQYTPFHPIAEWGRQRFGGADVPAEQRFVDLENSLALVKLDPSENAPLLAPLLGHSTAAGRRATFAAGGNATPELAALTNWVIAGARTQPIVLALEDCTGPILVRSISSRHCRARRSGPLASSHYRPTRVPAGLGNSLTSRDDFSRAARSFTGARNGGGTIRSACSTEASGRRRDRACRRRATVH